MTRFSKRLLYAACRLSSTYSPLGDADKNLDWLCCEAQAFTILNGTERAEGILYTLFVVPANV